MQPLLNQESQFTTMNPVSIPQFQNLNQYQQNQDIPTPSLAVNNPDYPVRVNAIKVEPFSPDSVIISEDSVIKQSESFNCSTPSAFVEYVKE